ncbi:MAG: leucine--tRNA ligase [Thermocladium sp.]
MLEVSRRWQNEWYSKGVFNGDVKEGAPKYFITVPYPYVQGPPHIGHGRTFTISDIIARLKRMQGYNVLFPIAWHITGTPIQSVADRLSKGDAELRDLYEWYVGIYIKDKGEISRIIESFKDPWNIAKFFANHYEEDLKLIGPSMDFTRQFTTGDPEYSSFIIWQYYKLRDNGFITRGKHVVLFSPVEGQAVGEHDIKGGDEINIEILEFNLVKFRLSDGKYLVAATFRPETIFGATNVWINPDATYVEAQVGGETWIISKQAAWKLSFQDKEVKVIRELRGRELLGARVINPVTESWLPVLPASFVDDDTGTGVVYSVPAHAPYDYIALVELASGDNEFSGVARGISPIGIIRVEGYGEWPAADIVKRMGIKSQLEKDKLNEATKIIYRDEYYSGVMRDNTSLAGVRVSEAKEKAIQLLKDKNAWDIMYETEPRLILTRGGNRVIVAVIRDQWFLNYGHPEWKPKIWEAFNSMRIMPESYRINFESTINWLNMRPCARKRGLGTRLPWDNEWVIESLSDSTIYMAFYTIARYVKSSDASKVLSELTSKVIQSNGTDEDALNKLLSFYDYVFLGKGKPLILSEVAEKARREFMYWYPVDQRHSGIDLIGNHLSFFIAHHAAIFPRDMWPKSITLNNFLIRNGQKMSRSLGNVLPLREAVSNYPPDMVRLYMAYEADLENLLDWKDNEVDVVLSRLVDFWRLANEIITMGKASLPTNELTLPSKWLLGKIDRLLITAPKLIESMSIRKYVLESFFNLLSSAEIYMDVKDSLPEFRSVLWEFLGKWLILLSPLMPHITEELWHRMGNSSLISLEKWITPAKEPSDEVDNAVDVVFRTIEDVRELLRLRKEAKLAHIYVGPSSELYELVSFISVKMEEKKDMGSIIKEASSNPRFNNIKSRIPDVAKRVFNGQIPRNIVSREMELNAFKYFGPVMEKKLGIKIMIHDALNPGQDPANKAKSAMPGRPAIYIE